MEAWARSKSATSGLGSFTLINNTNFAKEFVIIIFLVKGLVETFN